MTTLSAERVRDEIILAARILLILLFVVFGWSKLTDYSGTAGYMAQIGAPTAYGLGATHGPSLGVATLVQHSAARFAPEWFSHYLP